MKKKSSFKSGFIHARNLFGVLLCVSGVSLAMLSFAATRSSLSRLPKSPTVPPSSASPATGTLTSTNIGSANAINYADATGTLAPNLTFFAGSGTCQVPQSCSTFTLTIDPSVGIAAGSYDPTKYKIFIEVNWPHPQQDYDTWMCSGAGNCVQANVIASNTSTADPEVISLPTSQAPGVYTINLVNTTATGEPYTGIIYLAPLPTTQPCTGNCTPPRYINYPAGPGQADNAGEPSIGVDWNPNVPTLKDTSSADFTTGVMRKNTGGVAFFTSGPNEWRVNFDDCPSPAVNKWENVSATTTQQFVLSDPIGFVDHYSSNPLGLVYPPPHTPGRVFTIDLVGGQGNSLGSFSDTDGNSYTPGGTGGPGQGPDHETLGGGPYNPNSTPPPPPQPVAYGSPPNAIYYCSQNIVAEAQCSRSDNGGQSFGPGVAIYNPAVCSGGIHGHPKVALDGTVYVPNSSCGTPAGVSGVAVSTDNGLTWVENNVTGSVNGSQDPSVGVGQNNVGKPIGQMTNTIYLGYIDGNHAHVATSHDRGLTWVNNIDAGAPFGVTHAVFPVVVTGDDNRAAFGFIGTGDGISTNGSPCDPYGATLNCANIWHLYIATTYDGGANWVTIDATPNDPVQKGVVCLQGTLCAAGRNLLDFNDFSVDAEGRGLLGYADGCVSCSNTFDSQSGTSHGTVARQSGGRRLFAHFDPIEPMPPAPPQLVSAATQGTGALVTWLQPDNGGSPVTGYNVYRSGTSGSEAFLASVVGATTTQYLDPAPLSGSNFYTVQAVNGPVAGTMYNGGEGTHCGEVNLGVGPTVESECHPPGLSKLTDPAGDTNVTCGFVNGLPAPPPPGTDLLKFQIAQPYQPDNIARLEFTITTDNGQSPQPPGTAWYVAMKKSDGTFKAVHMFWSPSSPTVPIFESYTPGANINGGVDGRFVTPGTQKAAEPTSNYLAPFNQVVIVVKTSDLGLNTGDTISFLSGTTATSDPAHVGAGATCIIDDMPDFGGGAPYTGSYTVEDNQTCRLNAPPVALLTASPLTGNAPLTVHFDGSGSSDPDTAPPPDTIVSYHFDFGDGTTADCPGNAACTGTGKVDHTYNNGGNFPAQLTVTESRGGLMSSNPAQVTISVTNPLHLVSVVSRMTHGSDPQPGEVTMPLTGTRGVECRRSNSLGAGNYQIVFQFDGALTSVAGASVSSHDPTTANGSVQNSAIGMNNHEYIVNLTGVDDQQYITVTLTNVAGLANGPNLLGPQMGILVGDVNANGLVNSTDASLTSAQSGQPVVTQGTGANFRTDINANGLINSTDASIVRSVSGTGLPSSP